MSDILSQPLVSIILPTYNRLSCLPRCIDSVLAQTEENWELLIIDDGSQDGSAAYCLEKASQDNRIHYQAHANQKQALSKNAGIQAATGHYITFIDSDDAYLPSHLESRLDFFKDSTLDLLEGGFQAPSGMMVPNYFDRTQKISIEECVLGGTFFGKRNVFLEMGGFTNIAFGEDTEFWMRAEKKFKTLKIPGPKTYLYSSTPDGVTQSRLSHPSYIPRTRKIRS